MIQTIPQKLCRLTGKFCLWLPVLALIGISDAAPRRSSPVRRSPSRRPTPVALFQAVEKSDLARVKALLAKGANPNGVDETGSTPLMLTIQNRGSNALPIIQALLAKGANPNIKNKQGRVALHDAVYTHSVPLIQALIRKGANVNVSEQYGQTPLERAVEMKDVAVAKILLDAGAKQRLTPHHQPMLTTAASAGNIEIAKILLARGAKVNESAAGYPGGTALMAAAHAGQAAMVKFLLAKGAAVNAKNSSGETALSQAATFGYLEVAKALVAAGANVNMLDSEGSSLLVSAVISSMGEPDAPFVKLLLDHGANPNAGQEPALLWAAENGSIKTVKMLLDKGANANVYGVRGNPLLLVLSEGNNQRALMILYGFGGIMPQTQRAAIRQAAVQSDAAIVRMLIEHGVDVKKETNRGALLLAASTGNTAIVQLLLDHGAPLNVTDGDAFLPFLTMPGEESQFLTPLMLAARNGHAETVQLLLDKGVDVSARDKSGKTALMHLAESGRATVVRVSPRMREAVLHRANEGVEKPVSKQVTAKEKAEWHQWADAGDVAIIQALLAKSADANTRDAKGRTALMVAAANSSPAVVQALLEAKAEINAQDNSGVTALMHVIEAGRIQQAPQLFSQELQTSVEMAKRRGGYDPKTAKAWLDRVNAAFSQQKAAVLQEATAGDVAVIKALLAAGADINARDKKNRTALSIATQSKRTAIVALLQNSIKQSGSKP